ncbi:hypothetical protein R6Q59_009462 [Mikania micrantha]
MAFKLQVIVALLASRSSCNQLFINKAQATKQQAWKKISRTLQTKELREDYEACKEAKTGKRATRDRLVESMKTYLQSLGYQ